MRLAGIIFLLAPILCANGTAAAAIVDGYSADYTSCVKRANGNGDKINICTVTEIDNQNAQLNASYEALYSALTPYRRNLLQKSERLWTQFRDAECAFQGSELIGGPLGIEAHAQATLRAECILKQTYIRAKTLNDDLTKTDEGGPK